MEITVHFEPELKTRQNLNTVYFLVEGLLWDLKSPKVAQSRLKSPKVALSRLKSP